jgi:hypothetical protein
MPVLHKISSMSVSIYMSWNTQPSVAIYCASHSHHPQFPCHFLIGNDNILILKEFFVTRILQLLTSFCVSSV